MEAPRAEKNVWFWNGEVSDDQSMIKNYPFLLKDPLKAGKWFPDAPDLTDIQRIIFVLLKSKLDFADECWR